MTSSIAACTNLQAGSSRWWFPDHWCQSFRLLPTPSLMRLSRVSKSLKSSRLNSP
ncbi:F-box protein [Acidaminococcus timonensis]|uniref:F-box protein n=1 Tax=Acidaminococcus timonensis TaxID=1871002 RepID=UPI00350E5323